MKYWNASGSGFPPFLISVLQNIGILHHKKAKLRKHIRQSVAHRKTYMQWLVRAGGLSFFQSLRETRTILVSCTALQATADYGNINCEVFSFPNRHPWLIRCCKKHKWVFNREVVLKVCLQDHYEHLEQVETYFQASLSQPSPAQTSPGQNCIILEMLKLVES